MVNGDRHHCVGDGFLVGARYVVPDAPFEFLSDERVFDFGCNRLTCRECGADVRSQVGYRLASPHVDRAALRESGDWEGAVVKGWVARDPDGEWRTYLCLCRGWSEDSRRALDSPGDGDELLGERVPPWGCAGHERATLPFSVDGVTWRDDESAEELARDFLAGKLTALPEYLRQHPASWLLRCEALLRETPVAERIARACAAALADADVRVRTRAADFFRFLPTASGAERAGVVLRDRPDWFMGVPDPFSPKRPSDDRFQSVIGVRIGAGIAAPEELDVAKGLVDQGYVPNEWLARGLAQADRDWFLGRMADLLVRQPTPGMAARLVASAAHERSGEELVAPIVALAGSGLVSPDVIRKSVQMFVASPHREAILARLP
jgi:hypothetical protein